MKAYWKTKQGKKIEISKLSESHLKNILFMLKRKIDFKIAVYQKHEDNIKQLTNIVVNKKFKVDFVAVDLDKWFKSKAEEYDIEQLYYSEVEEPLSFWGL